MMAGEKEAERHGTTTSTSTIARGAKMEGITLPSSPIVLVIVLVLVLDHW
jgi:hypothetical protein